MGGYIATIYDEKSHPYTVYPSQLCKHLFDRFHMNKGMKLLDIGCGRGEFANGFKELGLIVNGVEREKIHIDGINVQYLDVEKDPLPYKEKTYDIVFSKSVIEHLENPSNMLKESRRILKSGGMIIIMAPDWVSQMKIYFDDYTHRTPFTKTSMNDCLKIHGFKYVNSELIYQLPILWKYPFLAFFSWIIRKLIPVDIKTNIKFIKWSRELMVLGYGIK